VAYGARLESVLGESPRGFESPILRCEPRYSLRYRGFSLPQYRLGWRAAWSERVSHGGSPVWRQQWAPLPGRRSAPIEARAATRAQPRKAAR
jgi:hypothetical protein